LAAPSFRAKDPAALGEWHCDHPGIPLVPSNYDGLPWQQEVTYSIRAVPGDNCLLWRCRQSLDDQFSCGEPDAMVAQLRAAGISVDVDQQRYPNGPSARLYDPEGNPGELWEQEGREAPR